MKLVRIRDSKLFEGHRVQLTLTGGRGVFRRCVGEIAGDLQRVHQAGCSGGTRGEWPWNHVCTFRERGDKAVSGGLVEVLAGQEAGGEPERPSSRDIRWRSFRMRDICVTQVQATACG
jgi:hypothetical protein